jgi:hypothetical protein
VGDRRGGARLAQEPEAPLLVADEIGRQDLERHGTPQHADSSPLEACRSAPLEAALYDKT